MEKPRPPYVTFEEREIEDRAASIDAGHMIMRSVTFAFITPPGSKDRLEKEATTWLADIAKAAQEQRFPEEWVEGYQKKFEAYKAGLEMPEEGTPILTWPAVTRAMAQNIVNANIRTVEDLAAANESSLAAIGMGARSLRDQAKAWLDSAGGQGKVSAELNSLRKQIEGLEIKAAADARRIEELELAASKNLTEA